VSRDVETETSSLQNATVQNNNKSQKSKPNHEFNSNLSTNPNHNSVIQILTLISFITLICTLHAFPHFRISTCLSQGEWRLRDQTEVGYMDDFIIQ